MLPLLKKLKYIDFEKKHIVLLVILAVVIRFWGESSITMLQKDVPLVTSTEISADEIDRYIQTKQVYLSENISVSRDIIVSRDIEKYLSKDVHEWFLVHGWRPKRFFYVEERIRRILYYIDSRAQKLDEADRLEKQAQDLMSFSAAENSPEARESSDAAAFMQQAKRIRYYINRELRHAGITEEEDSGVSQNKDILEQLSAL